MRIERVRIQKFRSLDDVDVYFGQVLAIVGANNAGKSHILRALNAFFNFKDEEESFNNQDHMFSSRSRPKITVTFYDIKDEDGIPTGYINDGKLTIRFTYRWDRSTPTYEVHVSQKYQTINKDIFDDLTSKFNYIYVPIIRDSETTFSDENGIAYSLLKAVLERQIARRNTLQPLVNNLYKKINDTVFNTAIKQIKKYYPFYDSNNFAFRISNNDPIDSILNDVTIELIENTQHNSIKNCGSGVQSAVYYAITLAASMYDDGSYMIGIEEPELNMHPQAQRELIESFKNTDKYPCSQFVITTHSTVIIDNLGHQSIALCRKGKGETRDIVTTVSQVSNDFWDKYQMVEERYSNFFEFKNSDFFFSNYVIIAESPIDCGIISHLLKKHYINASELGITFIPADGERNIKYPYSIVKELGIPFLCIVDRDVFQPYNGENRKESIDNSGLPTYKPELKSSSPICDLISEEDKQNLLNCLISNNYKNGIEVLEKYNIITMRYAIEIDLIACKSFCNTFFDVLEIQEPNRTTKHLTIDRCKKIKKLDIIRTVLDSNTTRNLPNSYRAIVNQVRLMTN